MRRPSSNANKPNKRRNKHLKQGMAMEDVDENTMDKVVAETDVVAMVVEVVVDEAIKITITTMTTIANLQDMESLINALDLVAKLNTVAECVDSGRTTHPKTTILALTMQHMSHRASVNSDKMDKIDNNKTVSMSTKAVEDLMYILVGCQSTIFNGPFLL